MNPKFRSQHHKTDMQSPQWLCRLTVGNESVNDWIDHSHGSMCFVLVASRTNTDLSLSYKAETMPGLSSRFFRSDISLAYKFQTIFHDEWYDVLVRFLPSLFLSIDIPPSWSISYKNIWQNTLTNVQTIGKVLNNVNDSID